MWIRDENSKSQITLKEIQIGTLKKCWLERDTLFTYQIGKDLSVIIPGISEGTGNSHSVYLLVGL